MRFPIYALTGAALALGIIDARAAALGERELCTRVQARKDERACVCRPRGPAGELRRKRAAEKEGCGVIADVRDVLGISEVSSSALWTALDEG